MNSERVKQLYYQAVQWCEENAVGTPVAWEFEEKFAELIIQDCLEKCRAEREEFIKLSSKNNGRESDFAFGSVNSSERIAAAIKEHFGVE